MGVHLRPFYVYLIVLVAAQCNADKYIFGNCPVVTPVAKVLTETPFNGATWYLWATTSGLGDLKLKCATYTFVGIATDVRYSLTVSGYEQLTGLPVSFTGVIDIFGTLTGSSLDVPFRITFRKPLYGTISRQYIVIVTAATHIVFYSCEDKAFGSLVDIVVLGSTMNPTAALQGMVITAIAKSLGSSWSSLNHYLKFTSLVSCP